MNDDSEGGDQFQRVISGLTEMQTHNYLGEPHLSWERT